MLQIPFNAEKILKAFSLCGEITECKPLNDGHINSTYVIKLNDKTKYTIQKINTNIFTDPDGLMENIVGVTTHIKDVLKSKGENPQRGTLTFLSCENGKYYFKEDDGSCWRIYEYIDGVRTCNKINCEKVFKNAGKAFGEFQHQLSDFPMSKLNETIPNFHDTYSRFNDFKKAVNDDASGRAAGVSELIDFALAREDDTHVLLDLINQKKLPLRVTHNDTKLNNILFDEETEEGICIIDLDTVMPGLSLYDFGDSIRFGANTAAEDESDVSKVSLSLPLYKAYVEGYLSSAKNSLTECEIEYLPFSAKLMTYECGIRFLGDYLNGDTYFKTDYPEHNLVRAKTQLVLVSDIEKKFDEMKKITFEAVNQF